MEKFKINLPQKFAQLFPDKQFIDCYIYDTLSSTNNQGWELDKDKIQTPFVVIAKQQTAGKGQRGNHWLSPEGGLYLTMVLSLQMPINNLNHLTLFSVVGIVKNLHIYKVPVSIKWLNDLILNNQKLGGILCETRSHGNLLSKAIIGVGINWRNNNNVNNYICLEDYLKENSNELVNSYQDLLKLTVLGILDGYYLYQCQTIDSVINLYNKYLIYSGKKVLLNDTLGEVMGVNSQGDLMVKFSGLGSSSKAIFSPQNYAISLYKPGLLTQLRER